MEDKERVNLDINLKEQLNIEESVEEISSTDSLYENTIKVENKSKKNIFNILKIDNYKKITLKKLLPIIILVIIALILITITIGIALFIIVMPGMAMENLKSISLKVGSVFSEYFNGTEELNLTDEHMYNALDYLEQMGYDLKNYGFLSDYVGAEEDGIIRNSENNIKEAKSDFVFSYLASDNYIYTISNYNNEKFRDKIKNKVNQLASKWGKGMLDIYTDNGLGVKGIPFYEANNLSVKINSKENLSKRTLEVNGDELKSLNMSGWSGKYGMPLEFLVTIHLATLMPDLAYDLIENFDTQITIFLHDANPYIAYVKNHWYRDIYFVETDEEFVAYNTNYEEEQKERWTLYETDENGNYIYYNIDENGNYGNRYEGDILEAENVSLAKKPVTIKESDYESLYWNNNSGKWMAYNTSSNGFIVQDGDGLRTETNSNIKKIFLQNRYFRYDGSSDTAEIIRALRKQNNLKYGALDNNVDLKNVKAILDGNEYNAKDYSGKVSLSQDTLNAFSMLENVHTIDADFVYRDFKELIVELGYFEKEELTDETPRLLQFIVPQIGSNGFPIRRLDKRDNEYGTMAHSKYDYAYNQIRSYRPNNTI